jgi:hypothetical protein
METSRAGGGFGIFSAVWPFSALRVGCVGWIILLKNPEKGPKTLKTNPKVWFVKKRYREHGVAKILVPATAPALRFWCNPANAGRELKLDEEHDPLSRLNYRRCKLVELKTSSHEQTALRPIFPPLLAQRLMFVLLLEECKFGGQTATEEENRLARLLALANEMDLGSVSPDDRQSLLFEVVQRRDPQSALRVTKMLLQRGDSRGMNIINAADVNNQAPIFYGCNFDDRPEVVSFALSAVGRVGVVGLSPSCEWCISSANP